MKTVYFKSGEAQWKYELDDDQYQDIIDSIEEDGIDHQELLDDSLEILRDISIIDDDEMDEDDEIDQTISVAFLWYYFNTLPEGKGRILGDIAVVEDDDGDGVTVVAAADVVD